MFQIYQFFWIFYLAYGIFHFKNKFKIFVKLSKNNAEFVLCKSNY